VLDTAVAIVIWRRPELTRRVLAEVARVQPRRLMVIADGPATPSDDAACREARAVVDQFDWEGEVLRDLSDEPLGMQRREVSGFDWVFEHCEEAILLEDDTLPHPHFFRFATELLERYRTEDRVMMIGGTDFRFAPERNGFSYRFSRYPGTWGWASWRRAWTRYDRSAAAWTTLREGDRLDRLLGDPAAAATWRKLFDPVYPSETSGTWDHQWVVTHWANDGVAIAPNVNLVQNIGFGPGGVNFTRDSRLSVPTAETAFPLRHPPDLSVDYRGDRLSFRKTVGMTSPIPGTLRPIWHALPSRARMALRNTYASVRSRSLARREGLGRRG
jgi:hypothetical protein